jgi:hypothetical protein
MNRNEQQPHNTNSEIDYLPIANGRQTQIKGGPNPKTKPTIALRSSATEQESALGDLEPNADVKGGPLGCGGTGSGSTVLNHNETMNAEADE